MDTKDPKAPKPHWWNAAHDLSWSKLKAAAVAEWHQLAAGTHKLESSVLEHAISVGHGAREVYARLGGWTDEVEAKLRKDWEQTNADARVTWEHVRGAVKHGWESTPKLGMG